MAEASELAPALATLLQSSSKVGTALIHLRTHAALHATRCVAAADALASARLDLRRARRENESARRTERLLGELEGARKLLDGGETSLRRCVAALEQVAQQTLPGGELPMTEGGGEGGGDGGGEVASERAFAELVETSDALASALEREWRAWLSSGVDTLWQGARALALAPPSSHSSGPDGLDRQRGCLELARAQLETAGRVDGLLARLRAAQPAEAVTAAWTYTCHELLRSDVASRCSSELQVACRLAAHATKADDADGGGELLEAVAEAAAACAKAARAVVSVFTLLPPPATPAAAPAAEPPAEPTADSLVQETASATDALLSRLRALPAPSDGKRGAALRALAAETSALLQRELAAATTLVAAAQSTKGRRALSLLGEAGERLAAAALAQARADKRVVPAT